MSAVVDNKPDKSIRLSLSQQLKILKLSLFTVGIGKLYQENILTEVKGYNDFAF